MLLLLGWRDLLQEREDLRAADGGFRERTQLSCDLDLDEVTVLEDERVRFVADHRGEQAIELRHYATSRTCAIVLVFTRVTCWASTTGRKRDA